MRVGRLLEGAATAALVVVVVAFVFGGLVGQPVLLGYVTTDSMEPAVSAGDGFVAVPAFLAGEPEPGDVVVYDAQHLHDGGLTTHRVVGETEGGYVTSGDANPFTDQAGGEPPVGEGQILAHALQVNGRVVTVPHLGTAATTLQAAVAAPFDAVGTERVGSVLVVAGVVLFVLAGVVGDRHGRERARRRRRESVVPARTLVLFAVVVVTTAATAAMVLPAGVHEFDLASASQPTDDPLVVEPGGTTQVDHSLHNAGVLPVVVILEPAGDGVAVEPDRTVLGGGARAAATVTMSAPDRTGVHARHVHESRYLLVLPPAVVAGLHAVHPLLALLAVDLVVAAFVLAAGVAVFGTGQLRLRTPPAHVPVATRLRRRLREWWR